MKKLITHIGTAILKVINSVQARVLICLLIPCLCSLRALATEEPYLNELKGSQVAANNFFSVSDEKFNSSVSWAKIEQNYTTDNIVSFEINFDTTVFFYNTPFSCTVNFKIFLYGNQSDTSLITDSTTHSNISLTVHYDSTTGKPYKGIAMYKFIGSHKYKVKILSITSAELSPILPIFRLKGQIIVNRHYKFQDISTDVTIYSIVNTNQLKLDWTPSNYTGAEQFDLEYTHIDYSSQIASTIAGGLSGGYYYVNDDSLAKWFRNNSTRITTAAPSYLINAAYDSGYVLFRIRGVQDSLGVRIEGNWNYKARPGTFDCSGDCPSGIVFFAGHEVLLNWQYSAVFAEEGKRKEVISYFDGTLRNRQSVTLNNTDNKNVVQETIYDALGRPAMNILPAPTKDSTIHYFRGFNRNSGGTNPYSFADINYASCSSSADSLSYLYGTGKYYSVADSFQSDFYYAKYIPNSKGYPFAVTEYMADNTGRIKAQGGVGSAFQLGSGKETKYFYGKPTQTELDRLFGSEAGNASHYLKNMVMDPNKEISVSYMDASGKTIATALAGAVPTNMHALPSYSGASVNVSNDLLLPTDFIRNPADYSMTASATFLAPVTGTYVFSYRVDSLTYRKLYGANKDSSICSNCYYDLEVLVKNGCDSVLGRDTVPAGNVFDTTCSSPPSSIKDSIHVSISEIGEYYVTFNLRVSRDAMDYYDSIHLAKNTDIKKLNYFLLEELKQTDFYGCYSNCKTCIGKLGTKSVFTGNFKSLFVGNDVSFLAEDSAWVGVLYDSLYANCQGMQAGCADNVCDERLDLLKRDVSPGGQYALYDSVYNLLESPINRLGMRSQLAWFPDEFGSRDSVMLVNIYGEDSLKVDVKQLNDTNFIKYWRESWADSLVKLHPEYCFYLWCVANSASNEFDRNVEDLMDADTAIARNWFDPADYKELLDADPFFNGGGNGVSFYNKMKDSLRLYSRMIVGYAQKDKNILQFIDMVLYCKSDLSCHAWDNCSPSDSCRSRNREWFLYKELYLNLKMQFYERARQTSSDTTFSHCSNCFIGNDLVGTSGFSCDSISKADFIIRNPCISDGGTVSDCIEFYYTKTNTKPIRNKLALYYRLKASPCSGNPGGYCYITGYIKPGDSVLLVEYAYLAVTDLELLSVRCDSLPYTSFVDTTCSKYCSGGNYNPYDRDSIYFHIEYGNPYIAPSSVPSGYGNCRFYPEFILHTGAADSAYCKFLNVWVCSYDSTCGGICSDTSYASHCIGGPYDSLYKKKVRRYPEYVNTAVFMAGIRAQNPQQGSTDNAQEVIDQCHANCDAQADIWMNILRRCNMDTAHTAALRAVLVEICSNGCSATTPFGTSSVPGSVGITYHSFEEAIVGILGGGAINDSCTQELLAMPYPYNRQPAYSDQLIMETNSAICSKIHYYDTTWQSSGYGGSFHSWLKQQLGSSYTLDSLSLDDLLNSCEHCNYLLKNDVVLPVPFIQDAPVCLTCDSVSAALTAFNTKFPTVDTLGDDYETLFTNFFNHRFGYSLSFIDYKNFLDSCSVHSPYNVKLCDLPMQQDAITDNSFGCTAELFASALTNAYNTYVVYIDSVRRDFQEAWMTKCMNAQPTLNMSADLYEYHYTLYYYDQSGNLVKTVPPEGVRLLDDYSISLLQQYRNGNIGNNYCSNSTSMVMYTGLVEFDENSTHVGSGPFSIEFSLKLTTFSDQGILSNSYAGWGGGINWGYAVNIISGRLVLLQAEGISSSSGIVEAKTPLLSSLISLNIWTHFVLERTSLNTVRIFINGNEIPLTYIHDTPVTGNIDQPYEPLFVGLSYRDAATSTLSTANMRHVRVYKRALPQTEARQNSMDYCGNPSSFESLLFWETFTEGQWAIVGGYQYVYDRINHEPGLAANSQQFETVISSYVPDHKLVTTYQYNSLNQVLQQYSPDGDTSVFFYDRLGRLTASQNKEQKDNASYSGASGRFSYTRYDSLGRITEVGEKSTSTDIRTINMLKEDSVSYWLGTGTDRQLTKTIYDNPVNTNLQDFNTSRKRVVASIYLENSGDAEGDSSLYNYDILGNVKTLSQYVKALVALDAGNGRKQVDYQYDLVSGKVNLVSYQHGKGDQFYYKYSYDADNRVIRSYSSRDKLLWIEDASYNYYLHGPLARTELGRYKVQGVDYVYTLQGWLKGINSDSLSHLYDIASDGRQGATFGRVSRDVYAFKLGYFDGDYIPIGAGANAFSEKVYTSPGSLEATGNPLYNGNISYSTLALSKINSTATTGYSYGYDQLNRLVEMRQHTSNAGSGWSNSNIITAYRESITYDANGNILKYLRKGTAATPDMDSLTYKYNYSGTDLLNNKLNYVKDSIPSGNYSVDIDNQSSNNYVYDKVGNLKKDVAESIDTIRWTVYGKINRIVKSSGGTIIDYGYDPGGNRTLKQVYDGSVTQKTFYIRDAQGNVLAVYSKKGSDDILWNEQHLYGSSRVGMWNPDTTVAANPPVVDSDPIYDSLMLGSRTYELTNHLGNVLATISDKKIGNDSSGTVNYYIAEVLSQNDYYPFGMKQPGRQYVAVDGYRYGFNGKENDNEVKGEGNQQDYGMRVYDPRLGRFLSVDPLTKSYAGLTPYQFASNTPILAIDRDGKEKLEAFFLLDKGNSGEVLTTNSTAIEITYDMKSKSISALYGTVGGNALKLDYQIDSKVFTVTEGKIEKSNIIEKYGQIGTRVSKGLLHTAKSLYDFLGAFGIKDNKFESSLDNFDTELWKGLEKEGLTSFHVSSRTLINDFFKSDFKLQVTEYEGSDIYRIFKNEGEDLSAIQQGLKLKLSLFQFENPKEDKSTETNQPPKPINLIDKRPTSDHPEDTKWKRDALQKSKMKETKLKTETP